MISHGFDNAPQYFTMDGAPTNTDTVIGSVRTNKGIEICTIEVKNTHASKALTNFEVWVKPHAASDFIKLVDDFSTEDSVMLTCTVAADTLAAQTSSVLILRTGPIDAIQFRAAVGSGTGSLTVRGGMN